MATLAGGGSVVAAFNSMLLATLHDACYYADDCSASFKRIAD
ncbi:hypothetical protein [Paraburkholderia sp. BR14374]